MILFVLSLLVATLGIVFAVQNNVWVDVTFFMWKFNEPMAIFLLIAFVAGAASMFLACLLYIIRLSSQAREYRKKIVDLERLANENPINYESEGLGKQGDFKS